MKTTELSRESCWDNELVRNECNDSAICIISYTIERFNLI